MHNLVPRFILQQFTHGRDNGRFQAATLFVDISGFTAVTEALMQQGKAGAEALADVMLAIFDPLIAAVYANGGFVTGFAGDAFTAVFTGRRTAVVARAVRTAWTIQQQMADTSTFATPFGNFAFTAKAGVAVGTVHWGILSGNGMRHTYFFRGPAIDGCAAAEHEAKGEQVVVTTAVYDAVQAHVTAVPVTTGFHRLTGVQPPLPIGTPRRRDRSTNDAAAASAFQPAHLLETDLRGEFRQVVTVFLNLQQPSPDALSTFMRTFFRLLAQYGGYLCRLDFGDKGCNLLLFWGAPIGHENDVVRALNFVLDLQAESDATLRAGITSRQAFAGFAGSPLREEYTCYGLGVNQAARQMMAAPWGALWLDENTARRVESGFALAPVGRFPFKGFTEAQAVFELNGRREATAPFYRGTLVGRDAELARLRAAMAPLENGRFGGVLIVSGEAGIGKSRLIHELVRDWGAGSGEREAGSDTHSSAHRFQHFLCQTDEILRQPLNPFRYWLRRYFGQSPTSAEAVNKATFDAKLDDVLAETDDAALRNELARTRSFLGALVDLFWDDSLYAQLEPELRFENTLTALKALIKAESMRRPVVLQIEDAHWLDAESVHFLQRLTHNVADVPFLVLLTSRDEDVAAQWELDDAPQQLKLTALGETAVRQLAKSQLGGSITDELAQTLAARADGNPFFAEQMVLYLQEQDALVTTAAGYAAPAIETALPLDVQAILVARLDRLTQAVKNVVQTAAVLGREFEVRVLSQMLRKETAVRERVTQAEEAAVWSALTELTYLFRHALLRDAAYQMQLQARLRELHAGAARALETLHAANLTAYAEEIGYHYEQGNHINRAVPYLRQAALAAKENYQNDQAIGLMDRVLAYADRLSVKEQISLLQEKASVLQFVGQSRKAEATLQEALALAETAVEPQQLGHVLNRLGALYHETGDFEAAEKVLSRALPLLQNAGDQAALCVTYRELGNAQEGFGNYDQATDYYQKSLETCRAVNDVWGEARANLNLGLMAWNKGEYDRSESLYRKARKGFQETGDIFSEGKILNNLGSVAWGRKEIKKARTYFERAYAIHRQCGSFLGQSITLGNLGTINFYLEKYEEAEKNHQRSLAISIEANDLYGIVFSKRNLADVYFVLKQPQKGKQMLQEGLQLATEIKADALILDYLITTADMVKETQPEKAWLLLSIVKTHPANYENMLWRASLVEEKLEPLPAAEMEQIEAEAQQQTLASLAQTLLATDLAKN